MKNISVVAAVIMHEHKILCVQRGHSDKTYVSNKWEFPGGKIEENETRIQALHREIREELTMEIAIQAFFMNIQHTYSDFHLSMDVYLCESATNQLQLQEHKSYKWLTIEELPSLDWAEADIPVVDRLIKKDFQ